MKGQYLAIETVLTFGMGLALAIGTITVFNNYRSYVIDSTTEKEVSLIQSEVRNTIFHLKSTDNGNMEVDLPSDIGGSDYSLSLYNGIRVSVNQNTYEKNLTGLNMRFDFEGTTNGGTVKIYKQEDNFILRPG